MTENDVIYFRRRAEEERRLAMSATCPQSARVHSALADAYLTRIGTLEIVPAGNLLRMAG